jgi:protein-S-isoprenylcysteine O-methyltransferase Ste14
MQRLLPPALAFISILMMLVLSYTAPVAIVINNLWIAGVLSLIGVILLLGGSSTFARVGTNIKTFNDPNKLVTSGLFRFSRNPMYLGFTCLLTGIAFALGTLSALAVAFSFFLITNFWYIAFEEKKMEEIFGEEYLAYKRQTRRWI